MQRKKSLLKRSDSKKKVLPTKLRPFDSISTETPGSQPPQAISLYSAENKTVSVKHVNEPLTREQVKLRSAFIQADSQQGICSVMVTGTSEGSGVSSVAVALAKGLSWDEQKKILLIDANFKRPKLDRFFQLDTDNGLANALSKGSNLLDVAVAVDRPNLMVIPMGKSDERNSMQSKRLAAAIPALHEAFDVVIIDTPPIALFPDVLMLSSYVDSVALVVEAEQIRIQNLDVIVKDLNKAQAKLLGVILNREKTYLPPSINNLF